MYISQRINAWSTDVGYAIVFCFCLNNENGFGNLFRNVIHFYMSSSYVYYEAMCVTLSFPTGTSKNEEKSKETILCLSKHLKAYRQK